MIIKNIVNLVDDVSSVLKIIGLMISGLVMKGVLVNIGSSNGLMPESTKSLPELMLTFHQ